MGGESMRAFFWAGVLGSALIAGCASPRAEPLAKAVAAAPRRAVQPSRYRLAIAPLEVDPVAAERAEKDDVPWSPVPLEVPKLRADLEEAIRASGAFARENVFFLDAL